MTEGKDPNFTAFPPINDIEDNLQDGSQNGFLGGLLGRFFRPDQPSASDSASVLTIDPEDDQGKLFKTSFHI